MELNIQSQVCGIILVGAMIFFSVRRHALGLKTWKAFLLWLNISLFCLICDIFAIFQTAKLVTLEGTASILNPTPLVTFSCKLYLVSLQLLALCVPIYALAGKQTGRTPSKRNYIICIGFTLMNIIITCCLPIQIEIVGNTLVRTGLASIATYIAVGIFFSIGNIYATIFCSKKRWHLLTAASVAFLIAALLHAVFKYLSIVSFSNAVGVLIMFIGLEDPEFLVDRITGLWKRSAALTYMDEHYFNNKPFNIVSMWIENTGKSNIILDKTHYITQYRKKTKKIKGVQIFRVGDDHICIIGNEKVPIETYKKMVKIAQKGLGEGENKGFRARGACLENSSIAHSSQEVSYLFTYMRYYAPRETDDICVIDKEVATEIEQQERIAVEVEVALANQRIVPCYQPIWSSKEKTFVSAEVLCRIRDSSGNIMFPNTFIPIAERNGMISRLSEEIFKLACDFYVKEKLHEHGIELLEVNLSGAQCGNPKLAETYLNIMKESKIDPRHINLEITESSALFSKQTLLQNMAKLQAAGVTFSLDDFGTGLSNLDYLASIPVNIVKFDRVLSMTYFNDKKGAHVMSNAIGMAQAMGMEVVVEGIEEEHQVFSMTTLGVDYIQGYYFSKPLFQNDFLEFIKKEKEENQKLV